MLSEVRAQGFPITQSPSPSGFEARANLDSESSPRSQSHARSRLSAQPHFGDGGVADVAESADGRRSPSGLHLGWD